MVHIICIQDCVSPWAAGDVVASFPDDLWPDACAKLSKLTRKYGGVFVIRDH